MITSKSQLPDPPAGKRWKLIAAGTPDDMQAKADEIEDSDDAAITELVWPGETGQAAQLYRLADIC